MGIPREAVAFAAGIHAVASARRTWEDVAHALDLLGFGCPDPGALEVAVSQWSLERLAGVGAGVVVVSKHSGRPS